VGVPVAASWHEDGALAAMLFDSEATINFPAMADAQQMDNVSFRIVGVDNPVIPHAQPVAVVSFQTVVGKGFQPQTHSSTLASMRARISGGSFRKAASNVV